MINNGRFKCQFKGKFMLYDESKLTNDLKSYLTQNGGFLKRKSPNLPVKVRVHLYIVKASILNPIHLDSKFDPIILVEYGNQKLTEEKIKNDSMEPLIGKCFQFDVKFPCESQLAISIKNRNIINSNDLIGETIIDLEDRFYADCYATCGLTKKFEMTGYNAWRDVLYPTQILAKLCKKFNLMPPKYINENLLIFHTSGDLLYESPAKNRTTSEDIDDTSESSDKEQAINKESDDEIEDLEDNLETKKLTNSASIKQKEKKINEIEEQLALDALNSWESITTVTLVPEHVETRSLYNHELTELEQGKIKMWIDMFALNENQKEPNIKPVDVSIRKPKKFQLRVIIYNTKEVTLDDYNPVTGERSSDIYIKGYLCDQVNQAQKTDTHYRSLDGEGNFNWRFIFDFEYLPAEQCIVYNKKSNFGFTSQERKVKPKLVLQCFDADQLTSDDHLGSLELNLANLVKGSRNPEACSLKMLSSKAPKINLFKAKYHKGWFPFKSVNTLSSNKLAVKILSSNLILLKILIMKFTG